MSTGTLLLLVLLLACPLAMFFMHGRGGHGAHAHDSHSADPDKGGHAGHGCGHGGNGTRADDTSIDELRRQRAELEREIREREAAGVDSPTR